MLRVGLGGDKRQGVSGISSEKPAVDRFRLLGENVEEIVELAMLWAKEEPRAPGGTCENAGEELELVAKAVGAERLIGLSKV